VTRRPESARFKAGRRGRHRHAGSAETKRWLAEHAPPEQPPWMTADAYIALMALRRRLEEA
jgi:hypothetical protein